jgi:cytoskeletal protein CcmA (bactofilin family)
MGVLDGVSSRVSWLFGWIRGDAAPSAAPPAGESQVAGGLAFEGNVTGDGDLTIAGKLKGDIAVRGVVRIEPGGEVEGNVSATLIVLGGIVRGRVAAVTGVELLPTGVLTGTITSGSLITQTGATFRGEVSVAPSARAER